MRTKEKKVGIGVLLEFLEVICLEEHPLGGVPVHRCSLDMQDFEKGCSSGLQSDHEGM